MENNSMMSLFEKVYNENNKTRFTELRKDNFVSQIKNHISGFEYADKFLTLDPTGQTTPINFDGTLSKKEYVFEGDIITGSTHFTKNPKFNSFIIEILYKESLLKYPKAQKVLQVFYQQFADGLQTALSFDKINFVTSLAA